ncbi:hypothetical protein DLAC_01990 [Tieghemostelium lacteum]|uniref:DUF7743 domain-containing protein n=1 Tax=Tieghemostelium lacteum TaxID=361077 RepID=A0A152A592_TIELA|nr:hypothetical protein DLAC_01990 [Tieghemostelium lacteum]|eukprot:KYR01400.1 hypothetical protein DLAC_01990 [Tieghemostelium lacteum]
MNKNTNIQLLAALFVLVSLVNSQSTGPTKNGLTIDSLSLSRTILNASSSLSQSTTISMTIEYTGLISSLFSGSFNSPNGAKVWISQNNFFNRTDHTANVQLCVALDDIFSCDLYDHDSIDCAYEISFSTSDTKEKIIFENEILTSSFPNSVLTVVQNNLPPAINGFVINVHPDGPLVSFEFDVSVYEIGLREISIKVYNGSGDSVFLSLSETPPTSNGLYYLEYLISPEKTGTDYYVDKLNVVDLNGNFIELSTGQIQQKFSISTFTVSKSSTPKYTTLFSYTDDSLPDNVTSSTYTTLTFNITLNSYLFPIYAAYSSLSFCTKYYHNSTFLTLYCTIPPNQAEDFYYIQWKSINSYINQKAFFNYYYQNDVTTEPILSSVEYSVKTINQLDPFYIEMNMTFATYGSYLDYISLIKIFNPDDLSGNLIQYGSNITEGVLSASFLLDTTKANLTQYLAFIRDTKGDYGEKVFKGPVTTPKYISPDLELEIQFGSDVFDFTNGTIAQVPFTVTTTTQNADQLTKFAIIYDDIHSMNIGDLSYYDIYGGLIASNLTHSTYSSWISMRYDDIPEHFTGGDFSIKLQYPGAKDSLYYYSTTCMTIIPPVAQPTIVTSLQMTPSGPVIDSTANEFINIVFQTKGSNVNYANVVFYQSQLQQSELDSIEFPCIVETPYSYDSLVAEYTCAIPIATLPSQTVFFYLKLGINNIDTPIYNYILQSSSLPSYFTIQGPQDNGLVPTIQQFQTSVTNNTLYINYNIINPTNYLLSHVKFNLFNRAVPATGDIDYDFKINQLTVIGIQLNGTTAINLCDLEGFTFEYIGNFGVYMSIDSPIPGVVWDFPYEILVDMDSNKQQFPNDIVCDYAGPRVVDFGVENPQFYDTTSGSVNVTLTFTITDDISGFSLLQGSIRSNTPDAYYFLDFNVLDSHLVSGNKNNGIYQYIFTLPQYSNATYVVSIISVLDQAFNERLYTSQNSLFLSNAYTLEAFSSVANPNTPSIQSITDTQESNANNLVITLSDAIEVSVYVTLDTYSETPFIGLTQVSPNTYQYNNFQNLNIISGVYYFSVCLEYSLTMKCLSPLDLEQLGLLNSLNIYTPNN